MSAVLRFSTGRSISRREGGLELCKRVAITSGNAGFYETSEPLSYYSCSKQTPQNILIVENKDTFFDIRRYMNAGNARIMGREFGTVIYGAGKGIWKTFEDYVNGAERYFLGKNALFYFGDLDFEGILIFEHLIGQKRYRESGIHIFKEAYEKMFGQYGNEFRQFSWKKESQEESLQEMPDFWRIWRRKTEKSSHRSGNYRMEAECGSQSQLMEIRKD